MTTVAEPTVSLFFAVKWMCPEARLHRNKHIFLDMNRFLEKLCGLRRVMILYLRII